MCVCVCVCVCVVFLKHKGLLGATRVVDDTDFMQGIKTYNSNVRLISSFNLRLQISFPVKFLSLCTLSPIS